ILEIAPGQPVTVGTTTRRQLDSVLVRWIIQNVGRTPRSAGLRMQLDTLIGDNDGVPFTVPGRSGLVSSSADFRTASAVPGFIPALERPSPRSPGRIAHLTLKPGNGIEPPSRVSLTLWPGASTFGSLTTWDVPILHMGKDSAVAMYWPEKSLKP